MQGGLNIQCGGIIAQDGSFRPALFYYGDDGRLLRIEDCVTGEIVFGVA